jgi:hypothetical protein
MKIAHSKIWNAYRHMRDIRQRPTHRDYVWASLLPLDWNTYREFESYILREVGLPPSDTHRLCRKDRSQGWVVDNLEWRTPREMAKTLDSTIIRRYRKRSLMLTEWSETCGIPYATVCARVSRGWPIQLAISIPPDQRFNWRRHLVMGYNTKYSIGSNNGTQNHC